MTWDQADWDYQLDDLDLLDVCSAIVVEDEGGSSFADQPAQIPGRDGVDLDDRAPEGPMMLTVRKVLRYTDDTGMVTHTNGQPGHVLENLSNIKRRYGRGLVPLRRTDPNAGRIRALVKSMTDPMKVSNRERFAYRWVLLCPSGSWQDNTATSQAAGSVSTGGDRRIFDPVVEIGAAGTLIYTSAVDATTYTITAAAGPTYPVTVDVGAGTIVDDNGDAAGDAVTFSDNRWLVLDPDSTTAITGTAAGSSSVTYRNRWA